MGIIKAYRKLGRKEFMRRWKLGMATINPRALVKIKLISLAGQSIGLLIAAIVLFFSGAWYITIPLLFAVVFTGAQFIEIYQQYNAMKAMNIQFGDLNELLKEEK